MNKVLLIVLVLIVVFGAFTFLGNKKLIPTTNNQPNSAKFQGVVTPPNNPVVTITLSNTGFEPKDATVKVGTRVVWINKSGKTATVNSDNHPTHLLYPFLNLGQFPDGSSVQVVFEKAGKYTYHNHLNSSEIGSVTAE